MAVRPSRLDKRERERTVLTSRTNGSEALPAGEERGSGLLLASHTNGNEALPAGEERGSGFLLASHTNGNEALPAGEDREGADCAHLSHE